MRRKILALALAALVLISVLPPGAAAETGTVIFESGAPDANGVFVVTMKISNMTVWGIQFAVKYDPAVIQPVDANGDPTETFADFAGVVQPWTEMVNQDIYPEEGLLGSTWIVSPSASGDQINEYGDAVIGSEPLDVFTFRFKRLKEGDAGLEIASKDKGGPYQSVVPQGLIAFSLLNDELAADVIFREAEDPNSGKSESFTPGSASGTGSTTPAGPTQPVKDPDTLLRSAVVLKIGSHAAVVNTNVTAIYPGERAVTAYAHDNRTFVPVRFVGERLGAEVDWDNDTQTVIVEKDGHKIEMAIGSSTYYLDGEAKTLDAPAELTPSTDGNFRTMVPIRFVSEALGYQVEWDQARNLVIIVSPALGWDMDGEAEAQAMDQAVINLAMYSNFV